MTINKYSIAVLMFIFSIILAGCCMSGKKHKKIAFSEQEREWLIYTKNDTLTFLSSNGDYEQFYVRSVYNEFMRRPDKFGCDIVEKEIYEVFFEKVKQNTPYKTFFISFSADYFSSYIEWYSFGSSHFHELPLYSYELNGKIYNDVWERPVTNNYNGNWIRLTYSKTKGLLRYELSDGKVFERVFN